MLRRFEQVTCKSLASQAHFFQQIRASKENKKKKSLADLKLLKRVIGVLAIYRKKKVSMDGQDTL